MQPDVSDAMGEAFVNDGVGDGWCGEDERGANGRIDIAQVRETLMTLDFFYGGMNGKDVISALKEFAEETAGKFLRIAGDTDGGDAMLGEESGDG